MAVGSNDVQHFAWDSVLERKRHAAEWVTKLLSEFSLDYLTRTVFVVFEWFAYIGQQRTGDKIVPLDRNAAAEGFLQDIGDSDALTCAGIEMLDEGHIDIAGQQRELHRSQFIESPALSAASGGDRFVPNCRHFFPQ